MLRKEVRRKLKELIYEHEGSLASFARKKDYLYTTLVNELSENDRKPVLNLERLIKHLYEYGYELIIRKK